MLPALSYEVLGKTYPVYVDVGLFEKLPEILLSLYFRLCENNNDTKEVDFSHPKLVILVDHHLKEKLDSLLNNELFKNFSIKVIPVVGGESAKSLKTVTAITNKLLPFIDRQTTLLVIGGGTLGDVGGFIASIFLRGLQWIYVPTTLLSQVDSSIGGKTALNTLFGKNLIGSFHFPKAVIIDPSLLKTLPMRHLKAGYVELIKHAVIHDENLFDEIEEFGETIFKNLSHLTSFIMKSLQLKIEIINEDWFENQNGTRQHLNLGHTTAHALEATFQYETLYHGEAVALGMKAAYDIANYHGICRGLDAVRVSKVLEKLHLPINYRGLLSSPIEKNAFFKFLRNDKKAKDGKIVFILPNGIGKGCQVTCILYTDVTNFFENSEFVWKVA